MTTFVTFCRLPLEYKGDLSTQLRHRESLRTNNSRFVPREESGFREESGLLEVEESDEKTFPGLVLGSE